MPRPLLLACFLACAGALSGQSNEANIIYRTLCFRQVNNITSLHVRGPGEGGMKEMPLWTAEFTRPDKMKLVDGKAVFFVPDKSPEAKEPFKPVAQVAVPPTNRVLFLFLPAPEGSPAPYEVRALAADEKSYPLGQTRVLNMAPVAMRIHLGENERVVGPGKGDILPKPKSLNKYDQFNVLIEFQRGEERMRVSNTRWKSSDRKGDLVIAFIDPVTKLPVSNLFEDVPATVDPNAAPANHGGDAPPPPPAPAPAAGARP